jgi:hypothetical protein
MGSFFWLLVDLMLVEIHGWAAMVFSSWQVEEASGHRGDGAWFPPYFSGLCFMGFGWSDIRRLADEGAAVAGIDADGLVVLAQGGVLT